MKSLITCCLLALSILDLLEILIAAQLSFILFTFTMALAVVRLKAAYFKEALYD